MSGDKISQIRDEIIQRNPTTLTKRVNIVFDGKQYNLRIPINFAQKAQIDPSKDEFEFTITMPELSSEQRLPILTGELVEREKKAKR